MAEHDHAKRAKAYLEDQCDRLDRGEQLARGNWASVCFPALVPAVLGLSLGCIDGASAAYGVPFDDPCPYHTDDAGVSVPDCEDPNCANSYACRESESDAGPPREDCANGKDDTGNGLIDCEDPVCASYHACRDVVAYAAPPEEICDNGKDDNSDGLIDCDDPQCVDHPGCAEDLYGVPSKEICDNGVDDNGDGTIDCDDPGCCDDLACNPVPLCPVPMYASPPE